MSTVSLWQTGPYLTPITSPSYDPGNLNLVYRGAFQRPDCIGNGNLSNPSLNEYFDINAFNPVPTGPVGNCQVGSLVGPGTVAMAAGLSKTFALGERIHHEVRKHIYELAESPQLRAAIDGCVLTFDLRKDNKRPNLRECGQSDRSD